MSTSFDARLTNACFICNGVNTFGRGIGAASIAGAGRSPEIHEGNTPCVKVYTALQLVSACCAVGFVRMGCMGTGGSDGSNVSDVYKLRRYAIRPAVCGEAIEVPESVEVAVSDPIYVERMFNPGAKTSTHFPWLEKYARSSPSVDAPTVTALADAAGE